MTVITVVAISAIAALFYAFVWPMVQRNIVQRTCDTYGADASGTRYKATKVTGQSLENDKTSKWKCCPGGKDGTGCIETE